MVGAGEESRTLDLNLGKVALYQLSYSRRTDANYNRGRRHVNEIGGASKPAPKDRPTNRCKTPANRFGTAKRAAGVATVVLVPGL